jgi:hypothetical protein
MVIKIDEEKKWVVWDAENHLIKKECTVRAINKRL